MQIVDLDLDHFNFFCPVSGQRISGADEYSRSPAQAALFISDIPDDPEIYDADLRAQWDAYQAAEPDLGPSIPDFLRQVASGAMVAFAVTTNGMACGPVSSTCWFVINMNWAAD